MPTVPLDRFLTSDIDDRSWTGLPVVLRPKSVLAMLGLIAPD